MSPKSLHISTAGEISLSDLKQCCNDLLRIICSKREPVYQKQSTSNTPNIRYPSLQWKPEFVGLTCWYLIKAMTVHAPFTQWPLTCRRRADRDPKFPSFQRLWWDWELTHDEHFTLLYKPGPWNTWKEDPGCCFRWLLQTSAGSEVQPDHAIYKKGAWDSEILNTRVIQANSFKSTQLGLVILDTAESTWE